MVVVCCNHTSGSHARHWTQPHIWDSDVTERVASLSLLPTLFLQTLLSRVSPKADWSWPLMFTACIMTGFGDAGASTVNDTASTNKTAGGKCTQGMQRRICIAVNFPWWVLLDCMCSYEKQSVKYDKWPRLVVYLEKMQLLNRSQESIATHSELARWDWKDGFKDGFMSDSARIHLSCHW